ncbi:MAG: hypothetical protein ILM98_11465 [Kiritimatiellae bacterium]|nr:hypothetical protein [Kiritimatiellia bacterium]
MVNPAEEEAFREEADFREEAAFRARLRDPGEDAGVQNPEGGVQDMGDWGLEYCLMGSPAQLVI